MIYISYSHYESMYTHYILCPLHVYIMGFSWNIEFLEIQLIYEVTLYRLWRRKKSDSKGITNSYVLTPTSFYSKSFS
jgi:hypothetical protein